MARWMCPHCHSYNTGIRCAWCGKFKPEPAQEPKKEEPKKD